MKEEPQRVFALRLFPDKDGIMYAKYVKRALDVFFCLIALIVLSVPIAMIALWIRYDTKGSVLFRQERFGRGKKIFLIYKFRTMRMDAPKDAPTHLLENPDKYITRSGRFLRKASLDELPQLLNILLGDMSLIGPRPALWNQYDLIAERDKYGANDVLPGLTGWAQVNGRDELPIPEKAWFDGEYVKRLSFRMDCLCFFRSIVAVLRHDGVVEGGTGRVS